MANTLTEDNKKAFCELVKACIGDRTLEKVSEDTEAAIKELKEYNALPDRLEGINRLSKNMLFRLKIGDFAKLPPMAHIELLTHEASFPQNGVTFQDFKAIVEDPANGIEEIETAARKAAKKSSEQMTAEITVKLTVKGKKQFFTIKDTFDNETIPETEDFNLCVEIGGKKYTFEIKP